MCNIYEFENWLERHVQTQCKLSIWFNCLTSWDTSCKDSIFIFNTCSVSAFFPLPMAKLATCWLTLPTCFECLLSWGHLHFLWLVCSFCLLSWVSHPRNSQFPAEKLAHCSIRTYDSEKSYRQPKRGKFRHFLLDSLKYACFHLP